MYFGVDWPRLKGRQRHQVITPKTKAMKEKSYRDLLKQYERIYHASWDMAREGKECNAMRFVWTRKAFDKYSYNIAKALGKRIGPLEPIYMARHLIGTEYEFSKKFPASIYAK